MNPCFIIDLSAVTIPGHPRANSFPTSGRFQNLFTTRQFELISSQRNEHLCEKRFPLLTLAAAVAALASGCANTERKFGRGVDNSTGSRPRRRFPPHRRADRPLSGAGRRLHHRRRARHQSHPRQDGHRLLRNGDRPLARPTDPSSPTSLRPGRPIPTALLPACVADSMFATDTYMGFSGGEVRCPSCPAAASRFSACPEPASEGFAARQPRSVSGLAFLL